MRKTSEVLKQIVINNTLQLLSKAIEPVLIYLSCGNDEQKLSSVKKNSEEKNFKQRRAHQRISSSTYLPRHLHLHYQK